MGLSDDIKIQITAEVAKALKNMGMVDDKSAKMKKKSESLFKQLKLGWVAVAGVVLGLSKAMTAAISKASDFEEANAKFGTVFRGVSKQANEMRKELVDAYGLSTTEATRFLASTQDLFVPLGVARDKAAGLSGEVVKLARDIASFNKLPTADVLRDMQSSMVGNFETTRKYGVVLSEATVKQRALEKGMKITNGRINAQDKALVALELITEGSADAVGDFARTQDSWANTMVQIKAIAEDVTVVVGQQMMKALGPTVKAFKDFIGTKEGMQTIADGISGLVTTFLVLKEVVMSVFFTIRGIVSAIVAVIKRDWEGARDALVENALDIGEGWKNTALEINRIWTEARDIQIENLNNIVTATEETDAELKQLNMDLAQFIATSDDAKKKKKIADLEDLKTRTEQANADEIGGKKAKDKIINQLDDALTKEKKKQLDQQETDYKAAHEVQAVIAETFVDGFMDGLVDMKSGSRSILVSMIKQFTSMIAGKLAARAAFYFTNPATIPLGVAALAAAGGVKVAGAAVVGKIESAAQGADFVTSGPQMLMVGDNPSGQERVQVTPSETTNNNGINIYGDITVQANDPDEFIDQLEERYENNGSRMFNR